MIHFVHLLYFILNKNYITEPRLELIPIRKIPIRRNPDYKDSRLEGSNRYIADPIKVYKIDFDLSFWKE
jgi:hypothetical protein